MLSKTTKTPKIFYTAKNNLAINQKQSELIAQLKQGLSKIEAQQASKDLAEYKKLKARKYELATGTLEVDIHPPPKGRQTVLK